MKRLGMLLFLPLMLPIMLTKAQDSPAPLPLAVEYQDKLYVMTTMPKSADDLPAALTYVSDQLSDYYGASWSPDGKKLAYGRNTIWDGKQTYQVATDFVYLSGSWTADGQLLFGHFEQQSEVIDYVAQIYSAAPKADAQPQLVVDKLSLKLGCGIGAELPMENRLWHEVGIGNTRPLWALTPYGLVYPANCERGESLYRPSTGENFSLAKGDLIRAVLSPDQSRLAGIAYDVDSQANKIVVVDLLTAAETSLMTTEPPQVIAWGKDGSLYYAAVSQSRSLLDGPAPAKASQVLALLNTASISEFTRANNIRLYRRTADGRETLLHEQDAYAVGALVAKDDMLIYSTIANGDAWVQAMADGKLGEREIYGEAAYAYTSTAVNYLTFKADGSVAEAVTLPGDLQRVAVP